MKKCLAILLSLTLAALLSAQTDPVKKVPKKADAAKTLAETDSLGKTSDPLIKSGILENKITEENLFNLRYSKFNTNTDDPEEYLKNEVIKIFSPQATINLNVEDVSLEQFQLEQPEIVRLKKVVDPIEEKKEVVVDESELQFGKKRLPGGPSQYDSRMEVRQLPPIDNWQQSVLRNASSVGIVVEKSMLHKVTDSIYQLDIGSTLGQRFNLCEGEAFASQPVVGEGTAFIVGENEMMTAAHVFSQGLERYAVVFGFEMINRQGAFESLIRASNIFYPKEYRLLDTDFDIASFTTDRPLKRKVLPVATDKTFPGGTRIYMIGHPSGLPKKLAVNASITADEHPHYFYSTLDAFQGNSGSPVFDLLSHEVIGVLVSGEIDYHWTGNCYTSIPCRIPYCKGEKVIRVGAVYPN
ncbi:MAG: serine protease [Bacteroidota bacterium]